MECRVEDLRYKEVVNVCSGERLGYVGDMLFDMERGCVLAVIIPGPFRFLGLFCRGEDYIIPWECVRRVAEDIVLIEVAGPYRRGKREKRPWFAWQSYEKERR
jgi:YlmC/YmxH family sporulation protein